MPKISGTFKIVVKENKIVSVTVDGKTMKEMDAHADNKPDFGKDYPSPATKLKHGCIGLGMAYELEGRAQCRWLYGKWF